MSSVVVKEANGVAAKGGAPRLDDFMGKLERAPRKVKVNKYAGNSKYVPIEQVEAELDSLYKGLWSTRNFRTQVIANEIVGSINLHVVHPVNGFEIVRTGSASVMIRTRKGTEFIDPQNKIQNGLVMDYPHLKSSCIANAARSLGQVFGRDLNRDEIMQYHTTNVIEQDEYVDAVVKIGKADTMEELNTVYKDILTDEQRQSKVVIEAASRRKAIILKSLAS